MPHTRRHFLKTAAATTIALTCTKVKNETKPNFLLILVDDLGWGDLSAYGAQDLKTPNIDALVSEGMKFTNFYANCPVCSPTRAALLSGRYQDFVGVPGVIRTFQNNSWGYLHPDVKLMPHLLQEHGYQTALIGKWHLGLSSPNIPNERGFDFFHGFLGDMMDDYYTHRRHGINYMRHNQEEIDPPGHATDLFTTWAQDYLKSKDRHKPFFLYLAYNAPHTPIQPPAEWVKRVQQRESNMETKRAHLVALIEHLDDGIGRVLQTLKETGLEQETIVLFTSDNGGQLNVGANNGPFRNGKGSLYEGGIKVPMCFKWPGKILSGSTSDRIGMTMDVLPTFFAAAGIPINHEIDGDSFLPTALGQDQPASSRDLFWGRREGEECPTCNFPIAGTIYGMRRGDWKLLQPHPGCEFELYNLSADPLEENNLAQEEPAKFQELSDALQRQLNEYAKVPWLPPEYREI
ncbi:N-acetylgalactosamine 6-sulfate sulfatase [candidate division KSB1 bacterium]|nr:sulfatase-like hydrolase/transferase [candidate division KSB1 bacterium]RQW07217.1 MAG: N-acetylgalactosamine 6-sulfate sulfatase [candidate division KSB1 bacterium]